MAKRKKTWLEIKATKPIEEWRRINKIYDQRRRKKNQLKVSGAELLNQIHSYRLVQTPGPADALIDEVRRALHLPHCWNDEDYTHAMARLEEIAVDLNKIKKKITPKTTQLANIVIMNIINSKDEDDVKATALISGVEYMAKQLSNTRVTELEESKTNYVMSMLRTMDGFYPDWLARYQYRIIEKLFNEKDIRFLAKKLNALVDSFDSRNNLLSILNVEQEDGAEIR